MFHTRVCNYFKLMQLSENPIKVCVTGAAGQLAYSLLPLLASGQVFGFKTPIVLQLLDIPPAMDILRGVVMELDDSSYPLLKDVIATDEPHIAFKDADVAILAGSIPRKENMQRRDLLQANAPIFEAQGRAIQEVAKPDVKIVVVGNPANTNALVLNNSAPKIPSKNITALTRLDHNRATSFLAKKLSVSTDQIQNVIIWGNHSSTQYPDTSKVTILSSNVTLEPHQPWLHGEFIDLVRQRAVKVLSARKQSSALSAAKAVADHVRDWWNGTGTITVSGKTIPRWTSMAVVSDGSYGVPKGLVFSFPVTIDPETKDWRIVQGLQLTLFDKTKIEESMKELEQERADALGMTMSGK